jgi:hydrogenase/urease accessory protein HupE
MITKLGLMLLFGIAASAHEIGTTRVSVVFHEGRSYAIGIVTDASSLREKLESVGGPAPQAELENRFRRRVNIKFGETTANPRITYQTAGTQATITMSGEIPDRAGPFTWSYGWTFVTYALTIRATDSSPAVTEWLEGSQESKPFTLAAAPAKPERLRTAWRYLTLGFTHILPKGLDHMLFVLGIYLLSRRKRHVLLQVSAFTIAHSITLGLSMYGIVTVTPKIVEPLIALSIAYVAIENIFLSELKAWRVALVFAFGLLHGLGFAGALRELGLPRSEFLTALLTFNVGVEAGQLAVIGAAFLLFGWHYASRPWYRSRIVIPVSAMIACTAIFWTLQRLHA